MDSLCPIQTPLVSPQPILSKERDEIVKTQFSKRFSFPTCASTPSSTQPYSTPRWSDPTLQVLKNKLNESKSHLSKIPPNKRFKHGRQMDPSGSVISVLRELLEELTNAHKHMVIIHYLILKLFPLFFQS